MSKKFGFFQKDVDEDEFCFPECSKLSMKPIPENGEVCLSRNGSLVAASQSTLQKLFRLSKSKSSPSPMASSSPAAEKKVNGYVRRNNSCSNPTRIKDECNNKKAKAAKKKASSRSGSPSSRLKRAVAGAFDFEDHQAKVVNQDISFYF